MQRNEIRIPENAVVGQFRGELRGLLTVPGLPADARVIEVFLDKATREVVVRTEAKEAEQVAGYDAEVVHPLELVVEAAGDSQAEQVPAIPGIDEDLPPAKKKAAKKKAAKEATDETRTGTDGEVAESATEGNSQA